MDHWTLPCPVVIVPTKYYTTPTSEFEQAGISLVIWANHLLRTNIKFMQDTASRIFKDKSLMGVEGNIASVEEVFRLQGVDELKRAEEKYLTQKLDEA
jgi:phosphoenolpyruvate phosphomutase